MNQQAVNFAKTLFDLKIPENCVQNTKDIFNTSKELSDALKNPAVKINEKHAVIDSIFDKEIRSYLKVLCDYKSMNIISQIFEAYDTIVLESKNMIKATLIYVSRPDDAQVLKIKQMVCNKYNKADVLLELREDPSLIGGFVLTVGDALYDKSIKGTLDSLYKTLVWR